LADVLNREMPNFRVTVQPTPGAIVSVTGYATGQFEGYYGADIAFYELANYTARFQGFKASMKRQPVQSFWTFTVEVGTAVNARHRAKFKGWADLTGKPIFTGPLPWDVRAHLERAYTALGIKHQYRQVDRSWRGAFVITGVPTKIGALLLDAAGVNLVAMVVVAFFFGALLGTGLPPAPTYIITALVIAPPMIKVGVDPWVVHFFAFLLAVWGEWTPPTSLVAAVTAKIAQASFMRTLMHSIMLCVSLFVLMGGVFSRPELVLEPGVAQIGALLLILTATIGISFSLQARFSLRRVVDIPLRLVLAAIALIVLFHPSRELAALACVAVAAFVAWWIWRCRALMLANGAKGAATARAH